MSRNGSIRIASRRNFLILGVAAAGTALAQPPAEWAPTRPITLVVPFPPGGPTDSIARAVADKMGKSLGQPVIVENRPGAGGAVAYDQVSRAAPDGHTICMIGASMVANAALGVLSLNPLRDFTPIAQLYNLETLLVVRPEIPANTVTELIAYLKANPGRLNYGSSGNGSLVHLQMEVFKALSGTFIVHVPYRGSSGTVLGLLGNEIQMSFDTAATFGPHIKSGALRLLAVAAPTRSIMYPAVPTVSESDPKLRDFNLTVWTGLGGPAGVSPAAVNRLNREAATALKNEDVIKVIRAAGASPAPITAEAFARRMADESVRLKEMISRLKIKVG